MTKTNHGYCRLLTSKLVISMIMCLVFQLVACKANYSQENAINQVINKELGKDYNVAYNEEKTYALCQQKRLNDHVNREIKYIVINVSNREIISRGSFQSGYAKWLTNDNIEVATTDAQSPNLIKRIIPIKSNQQ